MYLQISAFLVMAEWHMTCAILHVFTSHKLKYTDKYFFWVNNNSTYVASENQGLWI